MLQSLLLHCFATLMIIPITSSTPFQQFYPNLQTGGIQADHVPSDLESSYDSNQPVVDTSASKPVLLANSQLDWLWKSFFVPPPPSWQGTDNNIAAQFACGGSTGYCCTGRYDAERHYALQPCFNCAAHIPLPPQDQY